MAVNLHQLKAYLRHRWIATSKGHGVHSPFVYGLCENVFYSREAFYDFDLLHKVRQQLLRDTSVIDAGEFGAGSRTFTDRKRRVCDIAERSLSSRFQSQTLYRLASYLGVQTSIEFGTSLGLNSLYLALQNPAGKVITVEGSTALSVFARDLAGQLNIGNIEFVNGTFEAAASAAIERASGTTLVYVDGDHSYEATMANFERLRPLARENHIIVFDDIYWSPGMTKAWREIAADPQVRLSVDTFYHGYLFFRAEIREKIGYRLLV